MKVILSELDLSNRIIFCKNGEEVVRFFKNFLNELKRNIRESDVRHQAKPVVLLLMDINMPLKSGPEAKKEICDLYDQFNIEQQSRDSLADRV